MSFRSFTLFLSDLDNETLLKDINSVSTLSWQRTYCAFWLSFVNCQDYLLFSFGLKTDEPRVYVGTCRISEHIGLQGGMQGLRNHEIVNVFDMDCSLTQKDNSDEEECLGLTPTLDIVAGDVLYLYHKFKNLNFRTFDYNQYKMH